MFADWNLSWWNEAVPDPKGLAIKICLLLLLVFLVAHPHLYTSRITNHYLHRQIHYGVVPEVCVAPTQNIAQDDKGTYISIEDEKLYIGYEWAWTEKSKDRYLVLLMNDNGTMKRVIDSDKDNALRLIVADGIDFQQHRTLRGRVGTYNTKKKKEGCRYFG